MKRTFKLVVDVEPDPEAPRLLDEALDLLAGAIADRLLARELDRLRPPPGAPATSERNPQLETEDLEA